MQSLLPCFALHMPNIIQLNLNYIIIDQRNLYEIQRNQSDLLTFKISQSINAESACDRNNKSMYRSFMKARKRGETKEDSENVFF